MFNRVARLERAGKNAFAATLSPAFGLLDGVNECVNDGVNESVLSGGAPSPQLLLGVHLRNRPAQHFCLEWVQPTQFFTQPAFADGAYLIHGDFRGLSRAMDRHP